MAEGDEMHPFVTNERGREVSTSQGGAKKRGKSVSREAFGLAVGEMGERLERIEHAAEELENHMFGGLEEVKQSAADMDSKIIHMEESLESRFVRMEELMDSRVVQMEERVMVSVQSLREELEGVKADVLLCKKASLSDGHFGSFGAGRIDFPKPSRFTGVRDAKEVENFLWQMELYFDNLNMADEMAKIKTAASYLADTAMLWWRRKHADIERGTCRIETWIEFKKELKRQFYPENVVYEARKKLRELRQKGTIWDYVEEFTTLMLQIPAMTDEDLSFYFTDGLQSWAKQELQRRGVQSVDEAIAVAESLTDFQSQAQSEFKRRDKEKIGTRGGSERREPSRPFQPKGFTRDPRRDEFEAKKSSFVPRGGCYVCKGPYAMKDCPKLGSLSAMVEQHEAETHEESGKMGSLQLFNALKANPVAKTTSKGLMYVEATINGKQARVMVDTGATHNFMAKDEAVKLGIKWVKRDGWMKTVNTEAQPVNGVAREIEMRLGNWSGPVDFTIIPMDDFQVVLGMDFMRKVMAIPMPALSSVCIMEEGSTCMIPTIDDQGDGPKILSAM